MSALPHVAETERRRRLPAAVFVGLSALAAVAGAVLAMASGRHADAPRHVAPPSPSTVAAGDLRLTLPDGWKSTRTGPHVPGFEGARTAFVRSWNADVAIALLAPAGPSLLPVPLDTMGSPTASRPRVTQAGGLLAYHYLRAPKGKSVLDVVAVPTTRGVATVACLSADAAPGECDQALRGLHLARGAFLPLSPDAAFLVRLPAVTATLDSQRVRLRTRLEGAARSEDAARAARGLAAAYAAAARALRALTVPHGTAANTVRLLRELQRRYGTLAGALTTGDRAAFAVTARTIGRDESRLTARLASWQRALALARPG